MTFKIKREISNLFLRVPVLFLPKDFLNFFQIHFLKQLLNYLILHHYPRPQQNKKSPKLIPSNTLEWIFKPMISGKENETEKEWLHKKRRPKLIFFHNQDYYDQYNMLQHHNISD